MSGGLQDPGSCSVSFKPGATQTATPVTEALPGKVYGFPRTSSTDLLDWESKRVKQITKTPEMHQRKP